MALRRWLIRLCFGAAAIVLTVLGATAYLLWASLPKTEGTLEVEGPVAALTIERDSFAIPTIRAASLEDAYFGIGFAHAQDRLWQLELMRRIGQGRLAAVVGASALPVDRLMRTLGIYEVAGRSAAHLSEETRGYLEAYARGINAAIAATPVLPPEFLIFRHRPEPWVIEDSLVFMRLIAWDLGRNWREEVLNAQLAQRMTPQQMEDLYPEQPPGTPTSYDGQDLASWKGTGSGRRLPLSGENSGKGSNIWLLGADRTANGGAILANDPHLALQVPGPFYLAQIETPGLSLQGATMPSLPFIIAGRNETIAWGLTNTGPDSQDLFIEKLDPENLGSYLTPDGSAAFATRTEPIEVRGEEPIVLEVRASRHGPIVSDILASAGSIAAEDEVVALAWTALDAEDISVQSGFRINRARDWTSFVEALEDYGSPMPNVGYADKEGRIGLISAGDVPVRPGGDGTMPAQGWTGEDDWLGSIPFEELPRVLDPADQKLVNANNQLVGRDYPYLITRNWSPAFRARRIESLLETRAQWTVPEIEAMQLDIFSTLAQDFLPLLLAAADDPEITEPERAEIIEALRAWDRRMSTDAAEPLIFAAWYEALATVIYADELGPLFEAYRGIRSDFLLHVLKGSPVWCDDIGTAPEERCGPQLIRALDIALAALGEPWGGEWRDWRFGAAHRAVMPHQPFHEVPALAWLFDIAARKGGDSSSINVGHWDWRQPFDVTLAPTLRMIAEPASPMIRLVTATGQAGHPLSRHYDDLTREWEAGRYVTLELDSPASGRRLTLNPAQPAR